ncbi:uncharacterized protein KY384_000359 [Bacidia gigantensis]|uniref:uncharacterized protein n=1 Tax=Bacidia gigantensis TaxID=2732470 RepID=UPI001D0568D6|nr:uncharacterized protein KY384_000359 [Bacidia gigantensis]KAG8526366.1 hypothetical protein KY384_000359 [Bacidia gigantensis]
MTTTKPPLTLSAVFDKVPEVADLVVKELDPNDTKDLLIETDPLITRFCHGKGGGFDRLIAISSAGKKERKGIKRLPSLPRLLEGEWRKRLMGKRLVAEDAESDDTTFKKSDIPAPNRIGAAATDCYMDFKKNR